MKPTFAKLGLKLNNAINTIVINDQEIEIKQYLPINEKLTMIGNIINLAADENNFANPIKLDVFTKLELIFNYTNLAFTEKQKEDLVKLYDLCESNGIFDQVISAIDDNEVNEIIKGVTECANAVYAYRNSVLGVLDSIGQDYSALDFDATKIQEKLANEENLALLRNVLTKLG